MNSSLIVTFPIFGKHVVADIQHQPRIAVPVLQSFALYPVRVVKLQTFLIGYIQPVRRSESYSPLSTHIDTLYHLEFHAKSQRYIQRYRVVSRLGRIGQS